MAHKQKNDCYVRFGTFYGMLPVLLVEGGLVVAKVTNSSVPASDLVCL